MVVDLELGFREKPKNLEEVLASQGFVFNEKSGDYRHFDKEKSTRGVEFTFCDEVSLDANQLWTDIVPDPKEIVATGTLTTYYYRSDYDFQKQFDTAKFLRDHYKAILYDPQQRQKIID